MRNDPDFWQTLKSRKVHSTAAGYCVVAFLIWQLVEVLAGPLGLPEGVQRSVVLLSVAGFPIALLLSWLFDVRIGSSSPSADEEHIGAVLSRIRDVHRRSLWQLLTGYAVVCWLFLQFVETLSSLVGLPLWTGRATLTLVLAGFPLLMATATVQSAQSSGRELEAGSGWAGQLFTWRNVGLSGLVGILVLAGCTTGYVGLRNAGVGPFGTLTAKDILELSDPLILADLEDQTERSDLAQMVTDLLRIDLVQAGGLSILETRQLEPAADRAMISLDDGISESEAFDLAEREGIKAVLYGQLSQFGNRYVVSLTVAGADGTTLVRMREEAGSEDDLIRAVEEVSRRTMERVGQSLRQIQSAPALARVTTQSIPALRRYTAAQRLIGRDVDRAVGLLQDAISEDSTFAMAYRSLGALILQTGGPEATAEARDSALAKAFRYRHRLSDLERYLTEAAYHQWTARDLEAAIHAHENALEIAPDNIIALNNLASAYGSAGRQQDRLETLERAVALRGAPPQTLSQAVEAFALAGHQENALNVLRRLERDFPGHPITLWRAGLMAAATGDFGLAEERLEEALAARAGSWWQVESALAVVLAEQGRVQEALERYGSGYAKLSAGGPVPAAVARMEGQIRIAHGLPLRDLASRLPSLSKLWLAVADSVRDQHPGVSYATILLWNGDVEDAIETTTDWIEATGSELQLWEGFPYLNFLRKIAEGRADAALADVRECPDCFLELARTYDELDRPDSAVVYYRRLVESRTFETIENGVIGSRPSMRLAELLLQRGDTARAQAIYQQVADRLKDSDTELEPILSLARARAGGTAH